MSPSPAEVAPPARGWRAAVFAVVAVLLPLLLRASSDGPRPSLPVITAAAVLVATAVRPLTVRERRFPLVVCVLVGSQLLLHAGFLYASTGRFWHAGATGLFCSPASPGSGGAISCLPTHRGGALLFGVQLLAALLFAAWLRSLDHLVWTVVRTAVPALGSPLRRWVRLLTTAFEPMLPAVPASFTRSDSDPVPLPPVPTRAHGRRGPPATSATRLSLDHNFIDRVARLLVQAS